MSEAFTHMLERGDPQGIIALLLIFGGGFIISIVAIISHHWVVYRKREMDTSLKHEMIARGMSADEIERVLAAKSDVQRTP